MKTYNQLYIRRTSLRPPKVYVLPLQTAIGANPLEAKSVNIVIMPRYTRTVLGLSLLILALLQCKKDKPQPSSQCPGVDTMTITYQGYVANVMRQHCTSCHGGSNPAKGLALETYDQVKNSALSGKWYASMANGSMPPSGKLDDCTLAKLKRWIDTGYPQ